MGGVLREASKIDQSSGGRRGQRCLGGRKLVPLSEMAADAAAEVPERAAQALEPLPLWALPHTEKATAGGGINAVDARPARRRDDFIQVFMCQNSRHFF
jgi:hypothetical protein